MVLKENEVQMDSTADLVLLVLLVNEVLEVKHAANVTKAKPVDLVKMGDPVNKAQ